MSPPSPARIRRATAGDRDAVLAFCRNTFSWGDYIDQEWDNWLADPGGVLLVAEVADVPVAVGHARMMSATEAWLEGLRVHPAQRRRGIADAMNAAGCDWARARGASIARLATETTNEPALRQVARIGFVPVAEFGYWLAAADVRAGSTERRSGQSTDLPEIRSMWHGSDVFTAGAGLAALGWGWRRLTFDDLASGLADGRILIAAGGFGLLGAVADETRLMWLDDAPAVWERLLLTARRRAADDGHSQASALLPRHAGIEAALAGAGFEQAGAYRLLAKDL